MRKILVMVHQQANLCLCVLGCKVESISLNVDAVNTHRERPEVGITTYSQSQTRNNCFHLLLDGMAHQHARLKASNAQHHSVAQSISQKQISLSAVYSDGNVLKTSGMKQ